eukprot:scaffold51094_cov60-Phaeocystis_antarctica.AAC.1
MKFVAHEEAADELPLPLPRPREPCGARVIPVPLRHRSGIALHVPPHVLSIRLLRLAQPSDRTHGKFRGRAPTPTRLVFSAWRLAASG